MLLRGLHRKVSILAELCNDASWKSGFTAFVSYRVDQKPQEKLQNSVEEQEKAIKFGDVASYGHESLLFGFNCQGGTIYLPNNVNV